MCFFQWFHGFLMCIIWMYYRGTFEKSCSWDFSSTMKVITTEAPRAEDGFGRLTSKTNADDVELKWKNGVLMTCTGWLAFWQQVMSAGWTKADPSVVWSFDSRSQRKEREAKMSLIRSKWQEANVFIRISAKVSVMNLECSWKRQWGIELEGDKRLTLSGNGLGWRMESE